MGQTVLIVGASRGIGLRLAQLSAARGDHVIATVRRQSGALDGIAAQTVTVDVTAPETLAEAAVQIDRTVDLMVLNAGIYRGRGGIDAEDMGPDAWSETLMTNVAGPYFAVRALRSKLAQPGGKIAIISSIMGSSARAPGGSLIYRASKAAATNLACNLAAELAPLGIAVGSYHPGWVRTDMGGPHASIGVDESAAGLLARFDALGSQTTGVFEDYAGQPIPF